MYRNEHYKLESAPLFITRHFLFFIPAKRESASTGSGWIGFGRVLAVEYVTTAEDIRSRKSISLILPRQRQKYETILSPYIIQVFFDGQPSNQPSYSRRVS